MLSDMKLNFKCLLFAFLGVLFYSCSDDNEGHQPEVSLPYPITLKYQQKYEITDFKIYVGSPEGGRDISAEFNNPEKLWGERLTKYNHPDTIVFRSKDSISHLPHYVEMDDYKYEWRKDSLFAYGRYVDAWGLFGFGNETSFEYAMSFYKIGLVDEHGFFGTIGQTNGVTGSDDYFHSNTVDSPKEMTDIRDTIAWCNVRYIYK